MSVRDFTLMACRRVLGWTSRLAPVLLVALQAACSDGGSATEPTTPRLARIEVAPRTATLVGIGDTARFTATTTDSSGHPVADVVVAWASSSESVVSIDQAGVATAKSFGMAWMVASAENRTDSASVTVVPTVPITLLPRDWRLPRGEHIRFLTRTDGVDGGTLVWTVNGVPGGNDGVGRIDAVGNYAAPVTPLENPVTVRVAWLSEPTTYAEAGVTISPPGEESRVLWALWTPRAITPGAMDSATLEVGFSGYPRFELERPGGTTLAPEPLRSGVYVFTLPASSVTAGYVAGDLHNFVGFLNCDACVRVRRGNIFANVRDAAIPPVPITVLAEDVQSASHVVNIRYDDLFLGSTIPQPVVQKFYTHFPDDYDFVAIIEQVNSFKNRSYRGLRNDTRGLGLPIFDNAVAYGSPARLKGLIDYPISSFFDAAERAAIHEIGHRWMAFLDNPILAPGVPHWPLSSLARGIMGFSGSGGEGSDFPFELRDVGGGVREIICADRASEYNDAELYLMGLLSPDSVSTHEVFRDQNASLICGTQVETDPVTIADIIALNGPRIPDYQASQKDFALATIVLSGGRLLTPDEMAFFNHMALRGEATTELRFTSGFAEGMTRPFHLATGGRATLTTRVHSP